MSFRCNFCMLSLLLCYFIALVKHNSIENAKCDSGMVMEFLSAYSLLIFTLMVSSSLTLFWDLVTWLWLLA